MLKNLLVVLKNPIFYHIVFLLAHICQKTTKKPNTNRVNGKDHGINPICLGGGAQCALTAEIALKTQKNEKKNFLKVQICVSICVSKALKSISILMKYLCYMQKSFL